MAKGNKDLSIGKTSGAKEVTQVSPSNKVLLFNRTTTNFTIELGGNAIRLDSGRRVEIDKKYIEDPVISALVKNNKVSIIAKG